MGYILLALSSALLLGIWQFGLSLYRGKVSVYAVILLSTAAAGVVYVLLGAFQQSLTFNADDVPEGLIGGALNFTGTLLILKAFARGKVGVVVGVAALYVLVPLGYSIYLGEQLTAQATIGVALLLAGIATFYARTIRRSGAHETSNSPAPILLALGAAFFWGLAIVVLDVGSLVSVTGALAASQIPQIAMAATVLVVSSTHSMMGVSGRAVAVLAGSGVALALGNISFFTAANEGDIGVVAVLGSLSPMVTALLAALFFKERLARSDQAAFAIVLIGTALIVA